MSSESPSESRKQRRRPRPRPPATLRGTRATLRASRLLVRLRFLRLINMLASGLSRKKREPRIFGRLRRKRKATAGKRSSGWALAVLLGLCMLAGFTGMSFSATENVKQALRPALELPSVDEIVELLKDEGDERIEAHELTLTELRKIEDALERHMDEAIRYSRNSADRMAKLTKLTQLKAEVYDRLRRVGELPAGLSGTESSETEEDAPSSPATPTSSVPASKSTAEPPEAPLARGGADSEGHNAQPDEGAATPEVTTDVARGLSLLLLLLVLAVFCINMSATDLAKGEWDLEWLVTLPVSMSALTVIRVAEKTALNTMGWLGIWPLLSVIAWQSGHGALSPVLGLLVTLGVLLMLAAVRTVLETWLRLALSPARLRNLQALLSVAGIVFLYLAMSCGLEAARDSDFFIYYWMRAVPQELLWTPTGLPVLALVGPPQPTVAAAFALSAQLLLVLLVAARLTGHLVRSGILAAGARESGGRSPRPAEQRGPVRSRWLLNAVQSKELRLLGRDRSFLVQTLVLPALIGGGQLLFNPDMLQGALRHPAHLGALAFGIAAYTLMFSAFQTLNAEGEALWVLYTVPRPLERILFEKACLWGGLCLIYPVLILGAGAAATQKVSLELLAIAALVLAGLPIYAVIAACLGVFGSNPLAKDKRKRVRVGFLYLFMILAALYTKAIYSESFWNRLAILTLTALLATALWQRARDHLPYL
ncbi:hypothetical protein ACFL59_16250, partial [Planctomycetota bacterium]